MNKRIGKLIKWTSNMIRIQQLIIDELILYTVET